jgi:hypothetical protein
MKKIPGRHANYLTGNVLQKSFMLKEEGSSLAVCDWKAIDGTADSSSKY